MNADQYFSKPDHLAFFWKGRVALYALLDAFGVGSGDDVIVPGFTCVVVPNAVIYRGANPVYADIDPATYNVTAESIERVLTPRTRLIIVQSTFGLSPNLDPILDLANERGIPVVEDCAHGLGGYYRGQPNGTVADAAFMSLQWSKPISTGRGGVAYSPRPDVTEQVRSFQSNHTRPPGPLDQAGLLVQLAARPVLEIRKLYYPLVRLYRFLTQRYGVMAGSSSPEELTSTRMPNNFLKQGGWIQRLGFDRGIDRLAERVESRREVADHYDRVLEPHGLRPPARPNYATHGMLRYPIRVADKTGVLKRAKRTNIPVGDWFNSPIHPVTSDLGRWGYQEGGCPAAEKACQEVINLFTDRPLSAADLDRLLEGSADGRARRIS